MVRGANPDTECSGTSPARSAQGQIDTKDLIDAQGIADLLGLAHRPPGRHSRAYRLVRRSERQQLLAEGVVTRVPAAGVPLNRTLAPFRLGR